MKASMASGVKKVIFKDRKASVFARIHTDYRKAWIDISNHLKGDLGDNQEGAPSLMMERAIELLHKDVFGRGVRDVIGVEGHSNVIRIFTADPIDEGIFKQEAITPEPKNKPNAEVSRKMYFHQSNCFKDNPEPLYVVTKGQKILPYSRCSNCGVPGDRDYELEIANK
jgi:hypothetical protein